MGEQRETRLPFQVKRLERMVAWEKRKAEKESGTPYSTPEKTGSSARVLSDPKHPALEFS